VRQRALVVRDSLTPPVPSLHSYRIYYYLELSLVPSSAPPPVAMMLPMSFPGFLGTLACE